MPETFYGKWSVKVEQLNAGYDQRIVITGSDASDGVYPGVVGTFLPSVSGTEWTLTLEWNDNAGSGWQSSDIRRVASYAVDEGLAVRLGADDNYDAFQDYDYDDLIVLCLSLDAETNPYPPSPPPYDFTLPENWLVRP